MIYCLVDLIVVAVVMFFITRIWRLLFSRFGISTLLEGFYHRLSSRCTLRRGLLGMAGLMTLLALFYTEENWRGKRAWERCKQELEAKGEVLDWSAYIPPPVPDDQNFFKAPKMTEWFVGRGGHVFTKPADLNSLADFVLEHTTNNAVELTVVSPQAPVAAEEADLVLQYKNSVVTLAESGTDVARITVKGKNEAAVYVDPAVRARINKLAHDFIEPDTNTIAGTSLLGFQDFTLLAKPLNPIKPVRVIVRAETMPATNEIAGFFVNYPAPSGMRIQSTSSNSFHVWINPKSYTVAADYLAWSEQFEPDFELMRAALKRPYARMEGDYGLPFAMPIPNFVGIRLVAQMLGQRAQCHLLLKQPEQALHELTLIHELCHLLEARPTGKPMTLVAAMINVAVRGLYVGVVSDGLQLQAWREPELAAIQNQLGEVNLPPNVLAAFKSSRAAHCRTFEISTPTELAKLFGERETTNLWRKLKNPVFLFCTFAPRGWIYQNMASQALQDQKLVEGLDLTNRVVIPHELSRQNQRVEVMYSHFSPYTFLARTAQFNTIRATQTLAQNQTMANEALVVCALERYHMEHGQYPKALEALVPQFVEKLPQDIIGGQSLKYRCTDDGKFLLYSIGWNEKDDGGSTNLSKDDPADRNLADWVWSYRAKFVR
ncbi:MAG: hypothetical protein JWQ71_4390 [Pedosphaera sp.]|nr:hypothetical protein [Pedosphaera sp.]